MEKVYSEIPCKTPGGLGAIPFIGKGNIWLEESYDHHSEILFQNILFEAIENTEPGQIRIIGMDDSLSGIFSIFTPLSGKGQSIFRTYPYGSTVGELFQEVIDKIQTVQSAVQGRAKSLSEFRIKTGFPVEEYCLVALNINSEELSDEDLSKLILIMKKGPENGVSFIIKSKSSVMITSKKGESVKTIIPRLSGNTTIIDSELLSVVGPQPSTVDIEIRNQYILQNSIENSSEKYNNFNLPVVKIDEILSSKMWSQNSINGFEFSIGKDGSKICKVRVGDEKNQQHNVLITGAVGQGKTNLLFVIVHSLCYEYSPEEIELWLLDFKEGVSLQPLAEHARGSHLPHAKVIGIDCDEFYGEIVLDALYQEYQNRLRVFRENSFQDYNSARKSGIKIPRIVVFIDEFQLMFSGLRQSDRVARKLEKYIRIFRAAGIHLFLCSQSIRGGSAALGSNSAFYSQVPIRLALKNSKAESELSLSSGNFAAFNIRPREVIVNTNYGEKQSNNRAIVAYADPEYLKKIRMNFNNILHNKYSPNVLNRSDFVSPINIQNSNNAGLVIGKNIAVKESYQTIKLSQYYGENVVVLGNKGINGNSGQFEIEGILFSLIKQNEYRNYKLSYCDFTYDGLNVEEDKKYLIDEAVYGNLELINKLEFENKIDGYLDSDEPRIVLAAGLDGLTRSKALFETSALSKFIENGPQTGKHLIAHWNNYSKFIEQTSISGRRTEAFNNIILLNRSAHPSISLEIPDNFDDSQSAIYINKNIYDVPIRIIPFGRI